MTRWYRAYEGTVTDAKLHEAALVGETSRSVAIAAWHALLEAAAGEQDGGRYQTTPRRIAVILGEPVAAIVKLIAAFEEIGLISDGAVTAWKQRQFESDLSTERSRKHRENRRNGDATAKARCATPPDTETDSSVAKATGGDPPPLSAIDEIWIEQVPLLTALSQQTERKTRDRVGKALKQFPPEAVRDAFRAAIREKAGDPFAYAIRVLLPSPDAKARGSPASQKPSVQDVARRLADMGFDDEQTRPTNVLTLPATSRA